MTYRSRPLEQVQWDDPEGWDGEGGGRRVSGWYGYSHEAVCSLSNFPAPGRPGTPSRPRRGIASTVAIRRGIFQNWGGSEVHWGSQYRRCGNHCGPLHCVRLCTERSPATHLPSPAATARAGPHLGELESCPVNKTLTQEAGRHRPLLVTTLEAEMFIHSLDLFSI